VRPVMEPAATVPFLRVERGASLCDAMGQNVTRYVAM